MTYRILKECTMCGLCQEECPEGAIREESDRYVIDTEKCTDCGSCAAVCPVGACIPEEE